jgi:hypothetical protein
MKRLLLTFCLGSAALVAPSSFGQGTAFTYQGRLLTGAGPANGSYDFTFAVFLSSSGGSALWPAVTNPAVVVSNGLFTTTLDFGANPPGGPLFLEIAARTSGVGPFTTLTPRQPLTASPLALFANTTSNLLGALPAAQLSGKLLNSTLPSDPSFSGTVQAGGGFAGNGGSLSNIPYTGLRSFGSLGLFTNGLDFVLLSAPTVGRNPTYAGVADINGDGRPDAVSANYNDSTVTVLTNAGGGVLYSNATLLASTGAWSVLLTNLRGPGLPDMVIANSLTNTLLVYTNNGSGIFGSNNTLVVGNGPYYVISADVNGDGKPDLINGNFSDNTLTVLTNNGDGTFTLAATLPTGNGPIPVIAADINGDGKPDLIAGNFNTNQLSIFINNGNGTFFPFTVTVGNGPEGIAAVDVNGDGSLDLITANTRDNTLTVLTNNGNGTFTLAATLQVGATPRFVAAADLNGDGHPDLISADFGDNVLTVLTNDGHGNFVFAARPALRLNPRSVVVADMNGDGQPDLVSAGAGANNVTVLATVLGMRSTELTLPGQAGGLYLSPGENGVPNLVGGAAVNSVDAGVSGAVIAGGGTSNFLGQFSANRVSADYGSVGGGSGNLIQSGADHSFIGGGWNNVVGVNAWESVIAGGEGNFMGGEWSVIGGGDVNTNTGAYSFLGGGYGNLADGYFSTIVGGQQNTGPGSWSVTAGGYFNTNDGLVSFIGAGDFNIANGSYSFLGGGTYNHNDAYAGVLGGGNNNSIQPNASYSVIAGGNNNFVQSNASYSVISGGTGNSIGTNAFESVIGGGVANIIATNANGATIPGGYANQVNAPYGFAAGVGAAVNHYGSLVLDDGQFYYFGSTTSNEFSIRAQNGVRIQTDKGIHLQAADEPIIVRDWDVFATNAGPSKVGIGRWGLFMEPSTLVLGIPGDDLPFRDFQVAKYATNGTRTGLLTVDQAGNISGTAFYGNGANLYGLNASQITNGTLSPAQLPGYVVTNTETGVTLGGTFTGDGTGLSNVNAAALAGQPGSAYALLSSSPTFTGTVSAPSLIVSSAQITGLLRSGIGTSNSEPPSPDGLVLRRINSINPTAGLVVARTDNLTLERDGSNGGFLLRYPAVPGQLTISAMGIDSTGTSKNFYTFLNNPGTAGTVQVYTNSQNVVHFECTFGTTYIAGRHLTKVTLSRYGTDYFWSGDLVSTYNQ